MRGLIFFILFSLACAASPPAALGLEPHNGFILNTKIRCSDCHEALALNEISPAFNDSADKVCLRCHQGEKAAPSHPVGIKVKTALPVDIPLSREGKLMCITCHTFHASFYLPVLKKKVYLRRIVMERDFCLRCHGQDLPDKTVVSY